MTFTIAAHGGVLGVHCLIRDPYWNECWYTIWYKYNFWNMDIQSNGYRLRSINHHHGNKRKEDAAAQSSCIIKVWVTALILLFLAINSIKKLARYTIDQAIEN